MDSCFSLNFIIEKTLATKYAKKIGNIAFITARIIASLDFYHSYAVFAWKINLGH